MDKCGRCLRRSDCVVRQFAEATLPFVTSALRKVGMSDWMLEAELGRILRGNGGSGSPGFTEDAIEKFMMTRGDVNTLVKRIVASREASIEMLCSPCRCYQGPAL